MILKKYFVLLIMLFSAQPLIAGGSGVGNVTTTKLTLTTIQNIIDKDSYNLKSSMLNYLKTLNINAVGDSQVRGFFQRVLSNGELQKDILNSKYYRSPHCGEKKPNVPAQADLNRPGSDICFNDERLYNSYQNLSIEEAYIKIASVAFHEHAHHFQEKLYESEAYQVSSYVQLTAKFAQAPLLKWSPTADYNLNLLRKALQDEIKNIALTQKLSVRVTNELNEGEWHPMVWHTVSGAGLVLVATAFEKKLSPSLYDLIAKTGAAIWLSTFAQIGIDMFLSGKDIENGMKNTAETLSREIKNIDDYFMYKKFFAPGVSLEQAIYSKEINNIEVKIQGLRSEIVDAYCKNRYSLADIENAKCHKGFLTILSLEEQLTLKKLSNLKVFIDLEGAAK